MSTIDSSRDSRFEFRIAASAKRMIEQAAAACGQSLTEYSISRLLATARRDLSEHETTVLSDRDRDIFMNMLNSDAQPNKAMKIAASRYRKIRAKAHR